MAGGLSLCLRRNTFCQQRQKLSPSCQRGTLSQQRVTFFNRSSFIGNVPPAAHFSHQLEKWAKAHTVVSTDFRPLTRHENRDTSSKPPCCIRHRRRFGGFRLKPMVSKLPLPSRVSFVVGRSGNRLSNRPAAAPAQVKGRVRLPLGNTVPCGRTTSFFNHPRSSSVSRRKSIPCFGGI